MATPSRSFLIPNMPPPIVGAGMNLVPQITCPDARMAGTIDQAMEDASLYTRNVKKAKDIYGAAVVTQTTVEEAVRHQHAVTEVGT